MPEIKTQLPAASSVVYAQVALPLPVPEAFTYTLTLPADSPLPEPGVRMLVPFRNRQAIGYLVEITAVSSQKKLKAVEKILDESPLISLPLLRLTQWMSQYYACSWGEAIEAALPKALRKGHEYKRLLVKEKDAETECRTHTLNACQQKAFSAIESALKSNAQSSFLLHGITGSGKTEVYIRAIKTCLEMGKSAICLVPEIALTEQMKSFFLGQFPDTLEVLHSRMTDRERYFAWERIRAGSSRVVLGPRSALFSPLQSLGLIIIDEEQESSYKQEEAPRYHARDVARKRAEIENAVLLLGSATPSLETYYQCESGAMQKLSLPERVDDRPMPEIQLVDLRRQKEDHGKILAFSFPLANEIKKALQEKKSVLLLLNRRGFASQTQCLECGKILECPSCAVSLTYHQERARVVCHYCNYQQPVDAPCPDCKSVIMKYKGWGTEKIESEISRFFPQARVARMDMDATRKKGQHEKVFKQFKNREIDILVGTQMIAKGFDFPHVTVVGVISADVSLSLPDFRAGERTFQLLTQVAGRAGRGDSKGKVIIQTFSPHHPSIQFAAKHDYVAFYQKERDERKELGYPPFYHLINYIIQGKDEKKVYQTGRELKGLFTASPELKDAVKEILGPAPLPFYRLRGHFRWHLMIKCQDVIAVNLEVSKIMQGFRKSNLIKIMIDVDPVSVL